MGRIKSGTLPTARVGRVVIQRTTRAGMCARCYLYTKVILLVRSLLTNAPRNLTQSSWLPTYSVHSVIGANVQAAEHSAGKSSGLRWKIEVIGKKRLLVASIVGRE